MPKPLSSRTESLIELLKLGAPSSIAMLANFAMQLVDSIFVGRLGTAPLGGVSVGNALAFTIMVTGIGLLLGLDFFIAKAFGAKKYKECNHYLIQGVFLACALGVVFGFLTWGGSYCFEALGIEKAIADQARPYVQVQCWSIIPFLVFTVIRQYLNAVGVARAIAVILVLSNLVNALANYALVYGNLGMPRLEIAGSAWATLVARLFMLGSLVGYAYWYDRKKKLGLRETRFVFSWKDTKKIVLLGLPACLQVLMEVGAFSTATFIAGGLGQNPLAAHQIVLQTASMTFMLPLGMATAAASLVARSIGAENEPQARRFGWVAIVFSACAMFCTGTLLYFLKEPLLDLFAATPEVRAIAANVLIVAALFQVSDATQVVGAGVLRGAGNTRGSMFANLFGHWCVGVPLSFMLSRRLGVIGIWIGLAAGLTSVALVLLVLWNHRQKTFAREAIA